MAQFRATIQGQRGEASRLGSKASGLTVTCNGWNSGVTAEARYSESMGGDVIDLYATGGSNGGRREFIGCILKDGSFRRAL